MSTQTKDCLKKLAVIIFFENFYKRKKIYEHNHVSASMRCENNSNM